MNGPLYLYANASVDASVEIILHSPGVSEEAILILFGEEQVTLEFFDVESLERLRDIAEQGARRLRAVMEANARAQLAETARTGAA